MPHHAHRTSISRVQSKSQAEWLHLLEAELAKNPRSTVYSLATVFEGAPRVRNVVHRAFTPSGLLLTTTDLRMPKTSQLAADSRVEVAWLLPTLVQFRITGRAYIVPASGPSSVSRVSSLKVSRSFRSPRDPSSLRRTPSSVSNASSPGGSASPSAQPTPPLESVDSNLELTATPAPMSKEGSPAPPSLDNLKLTSSGDIQPPSTEGSDTSGAPSRPASGGRPRLQLTPTPAELSSEVGERATSPLIARSPRGSPPLSAASSSAPQFVPRAAPALNPAVTLESNSDITIPTLAGTLSALSSWGVAGTAPESSPSWWDAERARIWDRISPQLRATFARPSPPGSTLADAPSSDTWITKMESFAKTPEEAKTLSEAWENFAVLALAPERVEMLELDCEPHRRCCWHRDGDQWVKEELVP